MADAPKEYDWSLDALQDVVERDPVAGGEAAIEKLIENVQAVTDKITTDTEKSIDRIHAEADSQAIKLTAEAENAVNNIRENVAKAAANLIRESEKGGDTKQAAKTADKIIKEAEDSTARINRRVEMPFARLVNKRSPRPSSSSRLPTPLSGKRAPLRRR